MVCSVIILNYFGEKVIKKVLDSLVNQKFPKNQVEIIVVDNASKDKSLQILEDLQKSIQNLKLIKNSTNLGFSKGNNVGIKSATGDYVILLNNDCIVDSNWLTEIIKTAKKSPDIFAVNSKILPYPKY